MRKSLQSLKKRVKKLEQPGTSSSTNTVSQPRINGHSKEELLQEIDYLPQEAVKEIIKAVLFKLFSNEELKKSSISGKATSKTHGNPRQPLAPEKFSLFEEIVRKKIPSLTHREVVEKVQNIQKVLRREKRE